MSKNIFGKGLNKREWHNNYSKKEIINIYDYFSDYYLKVLKKLGIEIENKLYTEKKFDQFNIKLLEYYEIDKNDKIVQNDTLTKESVLKEDYEEILNIFNKIAKDYDL